MTADNAFARYLLRAPTAALALYVVVVLGLIAFTFSSLLDIVDRQSALSNSSQLLAQLQTRSLSANAGGGLAEHPGSPFLEGPTVTVAGASLLQRVAAAIQSAGGSIQSSSVDVAGTQAKDGFVSLLISCEMDQAALQKVLFDLESGMPFLFVDQLDMQSAQDNMTADVQRVRISLGVSGQWQPSK